MKKLIVSTAVASLVLGASLQAFSLFDIDVDKQVQSNNMLIKKYESVIEKLKKENQHLLDQKAKHPELFVKKPLFEDLKDKYIYRIKLNGAKANKLNFMVKDDVISVEMDMKKEEKSDNGYFYSSQYFGTSYSIPKDVDQEKISHKVEGDYFTIIMPKK